MARRHRGRVRRLEWGNEPAHYAQQQEQEPRPSSRPSTADSAHAHAAELNELQRGHGGGGGVRDYAAAATGHTERHPDASHPHPAAVRKAWGGAESATSLPPDAPPQPPPVWRPTGQTGGRAGAPQRHLPGWAAKERRLRAKLGGPAGVDESADGGGGAASPSEDLEDSGRSPAALHLHASGGAGPSDSSPLQPPHHASSLPWSPSPAEPQPQPLHLQLVMPRSSSTRHLFDDHHEEAAAVAPPLRQALPAASPMLSASRAPLAVSRAPSRRVLVQPSPAAGGRNPSAAPTTTPTAGPATFVFDSPPAAVRGVAAAAAASARSPSHGGDGHRVWSRGLAWLYDASDGEGSSAAVPALPGFSAAPAASRSAMTPLALPSPSSKHHQAAGPGRLSRGGGASSRAAGEPPSEPVRVPPKRPSPSSSVLPQPSGLQLQRDRLRTLAESSDDDEPARGGGQRDRFETAATTDDGGPTGFVARQSRRSPRNAGGLPAATQPWAPPAGIATADPPSVESGGAAAAAAGSATDGVSSLSTALPPPQAPPAVEEEDDIFGVLSALNGPGGDARGASGPAAPHLHSGSSNGGGMTRSSSFRPAQPMLSPQRGPSVAGGSNPQTVQAGGQAWGPASPPASRSAPRAAPQAWGSSPLLSSRPSPVAQQRPHETLHFPSPPVTARAVTPSIGALDIVAIARMRGNSNAVARQGAEAQSPPPRQMQQQQQPAPVQSRAGDAAAEWRGGDAVASPHSSSPHPYHPPKDRTDSSVDPLDAIRSPYLSWKDAAPRQGGPGGSPSAAAAPLSSVLQQALRSPPPRAAYGGGAAGGASAAVPARAAAFGAEAADIWNILYDDDA